ncbi:hypothetical protein GCM10009609_28620 [Pseudonocardia aurantiaca]|uniref:Uncharacterized protein n=1 Tax=Pseudonocardia aurantiaca TaxID=75290 RepID=A0ABW4FJQ3_9PSEU
MARDFRFSTNVLVQAVVPTPDRRAAAEDLVTRYPDQMSAEEALETPYLLICTAAQMAEQLRERRERYGFTSITVHEPYQEAFEPVVELRAPPLLNPDLAMGGISPEGPSGGDVRVLARVPRSTRTARTARPT